MKTNRQKSNATIRFAFQTSISSLALLAMVAAPLGCEAGERAEQESAINANALSGTEQGNTSERGRHKRFGKRGRGGKTHRSPAMMLLKTSLKQESLTDDQRAKIESLMNQVKQGRKGDHKGDFENKRVNLAQAVRAGRFDPQAMCTKFETVEQKRKEHQAEKSRALNQLYATLTPEQRIAIVNTVQTRMENKEAKFAHRGDRKGQGAKESHENGRRNGPDKNHWRKGKGRHGGKGFGLDKMVQNLNLTEEQQAQIEQLKATAKAGKQDKGDRQERRAAKKQCMENLLASFASDNFDAGAVVCQKGSAQNRTAKMEKRIAQMNSLLGILTQEQRNQLADSLENSNGHWGKERNL